MPNCGDCPCSEFSNSSVDRSKDIPSGATDKLRGAFQVNVMIKRTVREPL